MVEIEVISVAELGSVVRRLRAERQWTQTELADAAHVSRVFISQLENGKPRAEVRLVLAVLQALGASIRIASQERLDDPELLRDQPW